MEQHQQLPHGTPHQQLQQLQQLQQQLHNQSQKQQFMLQGEGGMVRNTSKGAMKPNTATTASSIASGASVFTPVPKSKNELELNALNVNNVLHVNNVPVPVVTNDSSDPLTGMVKDVVVAGGAQLGTFSINNPLLIYGTLQHLFTYFTEKMEASENAGNPEFLYRRWAASLSQGIQQRVIDDERLSSSRTKLLNLIQYLLKTSTEIKEQLRLLRSKIQG